MARVSWLMVCGMQQRLRQLFALDRLYGQKNAKPGQGMVGQRMKLLWFARLFSKWWQDCEGKAMGLRVFVLDRRE